MTNKTATLVGPGKNVPFISQIDDVQERQWQDKFCGIVAVYMVLSYWWQHEGTSDYPNLKTVSDYGLEIGGYSDGVGWVHSKLAEVARHYGRPATARSWFVREHDLTIMKDQNRLSNDNETGIYKNQVENEFVATLKNELASNVPIILSVKEKFGNNGGNHLIVITGISDDGATVTINDPETDQSEAQRPIPTNRLLEYSNFNAIFIYGKSN